MTQIRHLVKAEAYSCCWVCPTCVTTSLRTHTGALSGTARIPRAIVNDSHKTSFLHLLVVLLRDSKVLSFSHSLILAL